MTAIPPRNFALANVYGFRCFLIEGAHVVVKQGEIVQRDLVEAPLPPPGRPPVGYRKPPVPRWILRRLKAHVGELRSLDVSSS